MSAEDPISIRAVEAARERLRGRLRATPMVASPSLSQRTGAEVRLKLEHWQLTGSFKLRGATNAVLSLPEAARRAGVVGVSTGNHGRGLAHAAAGAGIRCAICMSSLVPANKVAAIRDLGAEVLIHGASQDEAEIEAKRLVAEEGLTMVSPFDDPDVIAGQGTIGLEIVEEAPDLETLIVPLSGGGLIAGVALAAKARRPDLRVVGVTMARGAAMIESLAAGRPVEVEEVASLADCLGGGIGLDNAHTFRLVSELVDETALVEEAEIAEAVRHAYARERQIIEGGAAVGIAALLAGKVAARGPTVVVLSGGNIDMDLHLRLLRGADGLEDGVA